MSTDGDDTRGGDATVAWSPPAAAPPAPPSWAAPAPVGPPPSSPWGAQGASSSGDGSPYGSPPGGAAPPPGWGPPPGAPGPAPQRSGRGIRVAFGLAGLLLLLATAFLVGAIVVTSGDDEPTATAVAPTTAETQGADVATTTTLPGGRLAPEPPIPTTDGPHEWFYVEPDGDPVAWDPCQPIHYVVNDELAPEGAMDIMADAIELVEQATGLVFVDDGATDETAPVGEDGVRPDSDPARYGDGWSPVLISWTDAMAHPELDGAAGLANPSWREAASGERVYITGFIEMAGDYAAGLIAQGRRDDVQGVMMHELGHLVGLAHVTPSDEVMTDDPESTPTVWGTGDLVGLATVGRGECEPDL